MSSKSGIQAALEEDGGPVIGDRDPADAPKQLSLVSDDELAQAELEEMAQPFGLPVPAGRRGPGRPKGSRNTTTEQTKAVVRKMGGDPQLALARMVAGGPGWIMRQAQGAHIEATGCKVDDDGRPMECGKAVTPIDAADATRLWQRAAEALAPFIMARAMKIEAEGLQGLMVNIFGGDVEVAGPDIGGGDELGGDHLRFPTNSDTYEDGDVAGTGEKSPADEDRQKSEGDSDDAG